jgi:hypothetical protein
MACLLQILAVLPDECTSNQLSIHPNRRAAVAEGLRNAATPVVFPALDSLAPKANDAHAQILLMEALAAWTTFEPAAQGSCPSATLGAAIQVLCHSDNDGGGERRRFTPQVVEAAVTAATAALVAAAHRPARREALGGALQALRQHCSSGAGGVGGGGGGVGEAVGESRARVVEVGLSLPRVRLVTWNILTINHSCFDCKTT